MLPTPNRQDRSKAPTRADAAYPGNGGIMQHSNVGAFMPDEAASPAPQNLERKLATILSADVAGYSRLMAEDEERTLRIFRGHKEVFEALVAMHKGRIFNTAGDAILAEFGSAVEAVRCATEIQAALQTRNNQFLPERQVKFRIGVNLGDVMVQGQDLLGDGVNLAARLQTAAEPGGICVSGSVYDQIRNKLSLSFNPLGERSYKNIPQPVRTFSITECEDHSTLPSPRTARRSSWVVGAVVLVTLVTAAYWTYPKNDRSKAAQARIQAEAAIKARPAAGEAQPASSATPQTLVRQESNPSAGHIAAAKAETPGLVATGSKPEASVRTAAAPRTAANLTGSAGRTSPDGVYSGQMCYGPFRELERVCFKSQATLANGRLSSRWPGRSASMTMYLAGEVSPSGEVQIHMHNEKDGIPKGGAELTGRLHDGQLDASGAFRNGRTATLTWHKKPPPPPLRTQRITK